MGISDRHARIGLVAITLAALGLRVNNVWNLHIPPDEAITLWFVTEMTPWELVVEMPKTQPHFPTYYLLLDVWFAVVGSGETAARIPSIIAGTLTVPVMYGVGREFYDRGVGAFAAVLTAVSPFMIEISQWIRMYAVFGFVISLSWWGLARLLRSRSRRDVALYLGGSAAMCFVHYFGVIILGVQWAWLAIRAYRGEETPAKAVLGSGVVATPAVLWVAYRIVWASTTSAENVIGLRTPRTWDALRFVVHFFMGESVAWPLMNHHYRIVGPALLLLMFASLYVMLYDGWGVDTKSLLLLLWIGVPFTVLFAYSVLRTPIFRPRYLVGAALGFYLGAARGVSIQQDYLIRCILAATLVLAVMAGTAVSYDQNSFGLDPAYNDIEAQTDGTEQIVTIGFFTKVRYWHLKDNDLELVATGRTVKETTVPVMGIDNRRLWIVHQDGGAWGDQDFAPEKVGLESYVVVSKTEYPKIRVYELQHRSEPVARASSSRLVA